MTSNGFPAVENRDFCWLNPQYFIVKHQRVNKTLYKQLHNEKFITQHNMFGFSSLCFFYQDSNRNGKTIRTLGFF